MPKKVREIPGCEGCPLRRKFPENTFVAPKFGTGDRLVVAEAPGEEESIQGEPLVGGSGRIFNKLCEKAGIKRDELTIINSINCRPPNNLYPTDAAARSYISAEDAKTAVAHCYKAHVEPLIKAKAWARVDLLGDKALQAVTDMVGIGTWRGSPVEVKATGKRIAMPTLHPSYVMREQDMIPVVINDLEKGTDVELENYNLYPTLDDLSRFTAKRFAFDIETTIPKAGEHPVILLVGLCAERTKSIVVPFKGGYIRELRRIFTAAESVIGHNCLQFDLPILSGAGIDISDNCVVWDTMLLQHLRFPNLPHDLEFVASQFCQKPAWKHDRVSFETYNARDVDATYQIFEKLYPLIEEERLVDLYLKVQVPLAKICREMQLTGFKVDPSRVGSIREKLLKEMQELEGKLPKELRSYDKGIKKREPAPEGTVGKSGKPVKFILVDATERVTPWRSPEQKKAFLYGKAEPWQLGLDEILDLKTGKVTTGKMALDKLFRRSKNPAIPALKRLNAIDELISTFASEAMAVAGKRMHPHFNVHGTASGRLSSSDPNLQNIPETARILYVPSHPGWKIIDVDYSQIENRLTAFLAGDRERLKRFEADPDFSEHRFAAALFLGIPYADVEKDNDKDAPYGKAKRIVHGSNYGMGAVKISKMYDMDLKDTKNLQAMWKAAIKETSKWQERTVKAAQDDGFLTTPFGRKRWFYTDSLYTEALSFIPQSTAADVIFRAMIALMHERIFLPLDIARQLIPVVEPLPMPARLLLQVHDSLVLECPNEQVDEVCNVLKRVMEQPWPELNGFSIPISIKVGDSWGETEKWSPASNTQGE